jgi:hypothetical protein
VDGSIFSEKLVFCSKSLRNVTVKAKLNPGLEQANGGQRSHVGEVARADL